MYRQQQQQQQVHSTPQTTNSKRSQYRQLLMSSTNNANPTPKQNCSKIFIPRDFSEGVAVKFSEEYPNALKGKIDADRYISVMKRLNSYYAQAESISIQSVLENIFGCLTAYFILLCIPTQYEKYVRKASQFIDDANTRLFHPRGIHMNDPMAKGLRCIEMTIQT